MRQHRTQLLKWAPLTIACLYLLMVTHLHAAPADKSPLSAIVGDVEVKSGALNVVPSTSRTGRQNQEEEEEAIPDSAFLVAQGNSQNSKISGLFGGKPFYLEKDPITGVVDFNTKTVKINNHDKEEEDYIYDDDNNEEQPSAEEIDRKDTNVNVRPNDILPYKNFPGHLNDFNNLRVQDYSNHKYHNEKFPLISSSYANTKVQGTAGGIIKNHRPLLTSSTPPPFYYTMRTQNPPQSSTTTTTTTLTPTLDEEEYEDYDDQSEDEIKPSTSSGQHVGINSGGPQAPPKSGYDGHKPTGIPSSVSDNGYPLSDYKFWDSSNSSGNSGFPSGGGEGASDASNGGKYGASANGGKFGSSSNKSEYDTSSNGSVFGSLFNENLYGVQSNGEGNKHASNGGSLVVSTPSPTSAGRPSQDTDYDETGFGEEVEYDDDEEPATDTDKKDQDKKHTHPSPVRDQQHINEVTEVPFRFTTIPSHPKSTINSTNNQPQTNKPPPNQPDARPNFPPNTQHVTQRPIAETTTATPPKATNILTTPYPHVAQGIVTSMPLGTHFHFKPPPQQPSLPKQPEPIVPQPPMKTQIVYQTTLRPHIADLAHGQSENINTNIVVGAGINHIGVGSHSSAAESHFASPPLKESPYGSLAEEPFKPIFGPAVEETRPFVRPGQSQTADIVVGATSQFIPPETPSRLNYPSNEGTSNYFSLPPHMQQPTLAPKFPGVEPPRQGPLPTFRPKPLSSVDISAPHKPLGHVIFPDDRPKPQTDNQLAANQKETVVNTEGPVINEINAHPIPNEEILPPFKHSNQPPPLHQKPPAPPRDVVQTPAQHLIPPAKPDHLVASNTWEMNDQKPANPTNIYTPPPPPQNARPKIDNLAAPSYVQGSSHNFAGGNHVARPNSGPGKRTNNQGPSDLNLPNILPQFRPNAKISHGHMEHGVRQQQPMQFGHQRQPLLERPGHRQPVGLVDSLQPPPPPPHIRINRNDEGVLEEEGEMFPFEKYPAIPPTPPMIQKRPLVHRRAGPQVAHVGESRRPQVATLQMMQHQQGRPLSRRDDLSDYHQSLKSPSSKYPLISTVSTQTSEDHPVFVVYPVNSAPVNIHGGSDSSGVVVGMRGPQLPLPPGNLESAEDFSLDNDEDEGPLARPFTRKQDQVPLLQLPSDKHDTPVLKAQASKSNYDVKPIKGDFPYALELPNPFSDGADETHDDPTEDGQNKIKKGEVPLSTSNKIYAPSVDENIQAEVHSSNINEPEDDTEINIIPYLQDYMPFATRKPFIMATKPTEKPLLGEKPNSWNFVNKYDSEARIVVGGNSNRISSTESLHSSSVIPVTLKNVALQVNSTTRPVYKATSSAPFKITDYPNFSQTGSVVDVDSHESPSSHKHAVVGSGDSEFTVSAVMHTHSHTNHQPGNSENAMSTTVTSPPSLNFQAPFMASANINGATPTNQGWSVVGAGEPMKLGAADRTDTIAESSDISSVSTLEKETSEPSNFDFENFKPQLFGGFKPIYKLPEEETDVPDKSSNKDLGVPSEREEKKLLNEKH